MTDDSKTAGAVVVVVLWLYATIESHCHDLRAFVGDDGGGGGDGGNDDDDDDDVVLWQWCVGGTGLLCEVTATRYSRIPTDSTSKFTPHHISPHHVHVPSVLSYLRGKYGMVLMVFFVGGGISFYLPSSQERQEESLSFFMP